MGRRKAILVSSFPLAVLLGAAFSFDVLVAASISWLFLGVVMALGVLAAGTAWALSRQAESLLPLVPFTVLLNVLPQIDISPLKPFARFYAAIEPGMTEVEVLRALDDRFPPTGCYSRPVVNRRVGPTHLGFILDPKDGRYDTEIVAIDFEERRVVRKQYYAD